MNHIYNIMKNLEEYNYSQRHIKLQMYGKFFLSIFNYPFL